MVSTRRAGTSGLAATTDDPEGLMRAGNAAKKAAAAARRLARQAAAALAAQQQAPQAPQAPQQTQQVASVATMTATATTPATATTTAPTTTTATATTPATATAPATTTTTTTTTTAAAPTPAPAPIRTSRSGSRQSTPKTSPTKATAAAATEEQENVQEEVIQEDVQPSQTSRRESKSSKKSSRAPSHEQENVQEPEKQDETAGEQVIDGGATEGDAAEEGGNQEEDPADGGGDEEVEEGEEEGEEESSEKKSSEDGEESELPEASELEPRLTDALGSNLLFPNQNLNTDSDDIDTSALETAQRHHDSQTAAASQIRAIDAAIAQSVNAAELVRQNGESSRHPSLTRSARASLERRHLQHEAAHLEDLTGESEAFKEAVILREDTLRMGETAAIEARDLRAQAAYLERLAAEDLALEDVVIQDAEARNLAAATEVLREIDADIAQREASRRVPSYTRSDIVALEARNLRHEAAHLEDLAAESDAFEEAVVLREDTLRVGETAAIEARDLRAQAAYLESLAADDSPGYQTAVVRSENSRRAASWDKRQREEEEKRAAAKVKADKEAADRLAAEEQQAAVEEAIRVEAAAQAKAKADKEAADLLAAAQQQAAVEEAIKVEAAAKAEKEAADQAQAARIAQMSQAPAGISSGVAMFQQAAADRRARTLQTLRDRDAADEAKAAEKAAEDMAELEREILRREAEQLLDEERRRRDDEDDERIFAAHRAIQARMAETAEERFERLERSYRDDVEQAAATLPEDDDLSGLDTSDLPLATLPEEDDLGGLDTPGIPRDPLDFRGIPYDGEFPDEDLPDDQNSEDPGDVDQDPQQGDEMDDDLEEPIPDQEFDEDGLMDYEPDEVTEKREKQAKARAFAAKQQGILDSVRDAAASQLAASVDVDEEPEEAEDSPSLNPYPQDDDDDLEDYEDEHEPRRRVSDLPLELDEEMEDEQQDPAALEQQRAREAAERQQAADDAALDEAIQDEIDREQAEADAAAKAKAAKDKEDRIAKEKADKEKKDFDEWNESDQKKTQAEKEDREMQRMLEALKAREERDERRREAEKKQQDEDRERDERRKAREKGQGQKPDRKQAGAKRGPDPEDEDDGANKKAKTDSVLNTTTGENEPDCIDTDSCKSFRDAMNMARFVYDPKAVNSVPSGPVEVGSYTSLDTIFMALASVTEAINKTRKAAQQSPLYGLFHPRSLVDHDIVGHPVVRTRYTALAPHQFPNDSPERPHYALVFIQQKEFLRRGHERDSFRMYNYDSIRASAVDFLQGDNKDIVRRTIIKAGWAGRADAEAESILSQCMDTEACQQPADLDWASGVHAILNGWACAFQLHHNKHALLHKTGFYENAVNLINLAIRGLVSSKMIHSFFECYKYTRADKTPADLRKSMNFKDSLKFDTYEKLNEYILGLLGRLPPVSGGLHHPDSRPPRPVTAGGFGDQESDEDDNYSPVLPPVLDRFVDGMETSLRKGSLASKSKVDVQPEFVYDPDHQSVDSHDSTNPRNADLLSDDEDDYDENGKKIEPNVDLPEDNGPRFDWRGQLITAETKAKAAADKKAKEQTLKEARETEQARIAFGPGFDDINDEDDDLFNADLDVDLEEDDENAQPPSETYSGLDDPYTGSGPPDSGEYSPTAGDAAEEAFYASSSTRPAGLPGLSNFSPSGSISSPTPHAGGLALPGAPSPTTYAPTAPMGIFPIAPPPTVQRPQPPPQTTVQPPRPTYPTPAPHPAVLSLRETGDIGARPYHSPPSPTNNTGSGTQSNNRSEPRRNSSLNESRRNRRDARRNDNDPPTNTNTTTTRRPSTQAPSPTTSQNSSCRSSLNLAIAPDTPPARPQPDPLTSLTEEDELDAWSTGFGDRPSVGYRERELDPDVAEALAGGYGGRSGPDGRYNLDPNEGWEDPAGELIAGDEDGEGGEDE